MQKSTMVGIDSCMAHQVDIADHFSIACDEPAVLSTLSCPHPDTSQCIFASDTTSNCPLTQTMSAGSIYAAPLQPDHARAHQIASPPTSSAWSPPAEQDLWSSSSTLVSATGSFISHPPFPPAYQACSAPARMENAATLLGFAATQPAFPTPVAEPQVFLPAAYCQSVWLPPMQQQEQQPINSSIPASSDVESRSLNFHPATSEVSPCVPSLSTHMNGQGSTLDCTDLGLSNYPHMASPVTSPGSTETYSSQSFHSPQTQTSFSDVSHNGGMDGNYVAGSSLCGALTSSNFAPMQATLTTTSNVLPPASDAMLPSTSPYAALVSGTHTLQPLNHGPPVASTVNTDATTLWQSPTAAHSRVTPTSHAVSYVNTEQAGSLSSAQTNHTLPRMSQAVENQMQKSISASLGHLPQVPLALNNMSPPHGAGHVSPASSDPGAPLKRRQLGLFEAAPKPTKTGSLWETNQMCPLHLRTRPTRLKPLESLVTNRRKFRCETCSSILEDWARQHGCYPNTSEKERLLRLVGMSLRQLNNWFCNHRRGDAKHTDTL